VVDLGAPLDLGLLDLDEIADMGVVLDLGAGAQAGERPDDGPFADPRSVRTEYGSSCAPSSTVLLSTTHPAWILTPRPIRVFPRSATFSSIVESAPTDTSVST
jgi:hypothetical protein